MVWQLGIKIEIPIKITLELNRQTEWIHESFSKFDPIWCHNDI